MGNGHFSTHGPYRYDAAAEFYRHQEEQRRLTERVERATHWLAIRVAGLTFSSLPELRAVCVDHVTAFYGAMDDELAAVVTKAVTNLWLGHISDVLLTAPKITATIEENPRTVHFAA